MSFNPNEQRDQGGKWTSGGAAPDAEDDAWDRALAKTAQKEADDLAQEHIKIVKAAADKVATDLNFDPNLISVRSDNMQFQLNGKSYDYAGAAYLTGPNAGKIEIFADKVSGSTTANVTAHEIGHQKFEKFRNDYKADYKAMTDATKDIDLDTFMKPNGLLKGEWADKFPVYQKYTEVMMPSILEDFAKSDGITDYSESWWKAWHEQKANTDQAMHETIAEMTAREYVNGPDFDLTSEKFKNAGYALDMSSSGNKVEYGVRKWKTSTKLDPKDLPAGLRSDLDKLQKTGKLPVIFKKKPAPEWVALYDAINENWAKAA